MSRRRDHARLARVLLVAASAAAAALSSGCKEEFSDEKFGVLDLSTFYDGGTRVNSGAGIPQDIQAQVGYINGEIAEFYDFGLVPAVSTASGEPLSVRVMPMYFFFDGGGTPLTSRPVREQRDGTDWMRGGKAVLNPNPKDFCAGMTPGDADPCKAENEKQRAIAYPLRRRDLLTDPNRGGTADYQRPIVDVVPGDNQPPRRQYTGLWEIVEVTVPDDYEPDAIKSVATLQKALDSGKFRQRATGRVINCPIVDERTNVSRGITARSIFHPRIELWYRRQIATCFLANGWETIGNPAGELFFAEQKAGFDTFDVARVKVGGGTELSVNVGVAYQPAVFGIFDPRSGEIDPGDVTKRIEGNFIVAERPRRAPNDAGGYTPMRWLHDVPAPLEYEVGTWKSVGDIDASNTVNTPVRVKNLAVRGVAAKCSLPRQPAFNNQCGRPVVQPGGAIVGVDATGDPVCNAERAPGDPALECNPETCFCDAPFVGYGQACGPGIAQCNPKGDKFSPGGYRCWPPWGGFCQIGCKRGSINERASENVGKELTEWVDSRCNGVKGMFCYPGLETCIKFCDQNQTGPEQCQANMMVGDMTLDVQEGQTCQDFGLHVCTWPDTYSPRSWPIPQ